MVKHIKKNYAKDGKLTKREKSIAYATAWKHHNEEVSPLSQQKDHTKLVIPKSAKKDLDKISKAKDKSWWKDQDKKMSEGSTNKFSYRGTEDGPLGSMPKGTKAIGSRTKKNKIEEGLKAQFEPEYSEAKRRVGNRIRGKLGLKKKPELNWKKDLGIKEAENPLTRELHPEVLKKKKKTVKETAEYKAAMGPGSHEWGTDIGRDYFKKITPGQNNPPEDPIKPLSITARKPEDEKGVKVTEAYPVYKTQDYIKRQDQGWSKKAKQEKATKKLGKKILSKRIAEVLDLSTIEPNQADHSKHRYPKDNETETFDTGDKDHWLTGKDGEWFIQDEDVVALDKEAENITFDQSVKLGLYDDDELAWDDFDNTPGFDNEVEVTEALSVQGRLKRRFNARRNKQKLKVARRIALRRGSTPDRLKKRATRGARLMVYKRLLRGRDRAGLPPAEKARLERMIQRFQPLVSRISVKLLPQMRKNEIKRLVGRGKLKAKSSKKFKPAKSISTTSKRTKRFKIKKQKGYKAPKRAKPKSYIRSGGPTIKKASKSYKAFSYSVG